MKKLLVLVILLAACVGRAESVVEKTRVYGPRQLGAGAMHRDVAQTYDLYLPAQRGKVPSDAPFFLFIHGGAWLAGSKEDGALLLQGMANQGFVCVSMNYALAAPEKSGVCSFADMLRDVDLMVAHLPELFKEIGLKKDRIAMGGFSAGGHLALLYAYDGANPSVLDLGLRHALPVACVYSDCGPTDLASKEFEVAIRAASPKNPGWLTALVNALSGCNPAEKDLEVVRARLARFSPVTLVTDKVPPTIAVYGETHKVKGTEVGTDGIIARQNYDALTNRLASAGATFSAKLTNHPHCMALARDPTLAPWVLQALRTYLSAQPPEVCAEGDLASAVAEDLTHQVRPGGGPQGRPFWNARSVMFMYPPSFDFAAEKDAVRYRFDVQASDGRLHRFFADTPQAPLTNLWTKLPTGFTSVICRAEPGGTLVGARTFWKSAPFTGDYPKAPRSFAEGARKALLYVLEAPSSKYLLAHGELDPTFSHNVYPTKMLSSLIDAACAIVRVEPARREEALKLARTAADWLIANSAKADEPLAYFPPTYRGELYAAKKNAGVCMTVYPARAALSYLALAEAGGGERYAEAAARVAETYLKIQAEDGSWPIKIRFSDGSLTNPNRLVPVDSVLPLMEKLFARTGRADYRRSAELALADLRRSRVATWNWEGQFEDVEPSPAYSNLTKYGPCDTIQRLLELYPDDPAQVALARELLRFSEDQFVCWEKPFVTADFKVNGTLQELDKWMCPATLEQYNWYTPIDASAAKLVEAYLAIYRVERKPLDLAKARALGASILRQQEPAGWIHTHWAWDETEEKIWMNCHVGAALALQKLAAAEADDAARLEQVSEKAAVCAGRLESHSRLDL